jgi:hypothetical protein
MRTRLPGSGETREKKATAARTGAPSLPAVVGLLLSALVVSCDDYRVCPTVAEARTARVPLLLSETGLFTDVKSELLAPGVRAYSPQFPLWSDGAEKRRWVWLPPGSRVDTRDQDAWIFPEGTRFWKEFQRDGVRVETRLLQKVGPADADWVSVAYVWSDDESEAVATPDGAVNARGTAHDVPAANECMACHGGRASRVLGFSAIQLSMEAQPGELALRELIDTDRLTDPPPGELTVPGNATERAALGYLHANCGHCHNQERPASDGPRCYNPENELDFWLQTGKLASPSATPTYASAVGHVVAPRDPDGSKLFRLAGSRGAGRQMPPLATERVDDAGVALLRAWIEGLQTQ